MTSQAESKNQTGSISKTDMERLWRTDPVKAGMIRDGVPITRDNYIGRNWGEEPEEWTAEHEEALPEELQDWERFEEHQR